MPEERQTIDVPGKGSVSAILTPAADPRWLFVYAHGAGSNIDDPFAVFASRLLPERGIEVMRFQFPYRERGRGRPDPNPVLEATWRAVLARGRERPAKVVAGGRSMGGRIASQVAAAGEPLDALALFAYPLHPPNRPDQRRDSHLGQITLPALFCSGTRDGFATPDELRAAAALLPQAAVHLLEGADHGFGVPKSMGRKKEDVWREACEALVKFLPET